MEVWKDIIGYEGIYKVSSFGNIRSIVLPFVSTIIAFRHNKNGEKKYYNRDFVRKGKDKILKPSTSTGYCVVSLTKNKITEHYKVHRIVAKHFIPNIDNKPQINHKNGIKTDNRIENLEWCTQSENVIHAYRTGLTKPSKICGEKHHACKLTDIQIDEIRGLKGKERLKVTALKYNISVGYIREIRVGNYRKQQNN